MLRKEEGYLPGATRPVASGMTPLSSASNIFRSADHLEVLVSFHGENFLNRITFFYNFFIFIEISCY